MFIIDIGLTSFDAKLNFQGVFLCYDIKKPLVNYVIPLRNIEKLAKKLITWTKNLEKPWNQVEIFEIVN
jgi:hypothetical protein